MIQKLPHTGAKCAVSFHTDANLHQCDGLHSERQAERNGKTHFAPVWPDLKEQSAARSSRGKREVGLPFPQ